MGGCVLIRGGGDLASGAALRLTRVGIKVFITELSQPLAVRRMVSFAQAVYTGEIAIEGIHAQLASSPDEMLELMNRGIIPVLIDPQSEIRQTVHPVVIVDGRMTKRPPDLSINAAPMVVGLGPGFTAGENCHAVIETKRGHTLGRVYWQGTAEPDTGIPEAVARRQAERVLRAPVEGILKTYVQIGEIVDSGRLVAEVDGRPVRAAFRGVVRGLLQAGLLVKQGLKIGDLDPRADLQLSTLVSEKALAIGGGVLEAVLTREEIRKRLWD